MESIFKTCKLLRIVILLMMLTCGFFNVFSEEKVRTINIKANYTLTITEPSIEPYIDDNEYTNKFIYDEFENPKLDQLRTQYSLDSVISSANTEFEKQILLMGWVFEQVNPHYGPGVPSRMGALESLEVFEDPESVGNCVDAQEIYVSVAACFGWICRGIKLRRPSVYSLEYYTRATGQHSVTEIWSNQYKKWIMMDPMSDVYVTDLDGIPMNAYEIRQDFFDTDGANMIVIEHEIPYYNDQPPRIQRAREEGAEAIAARLTKEEYYLTGGYRKNGFPAEHYANIAWVGNTNLMDIEPAPAGLVIRCSAEICTDSTDILDWYSFLPAPENPEKDTYFSMQQVEVTATPQGDSAIAMSFETRTPNFETYQIRIDGGDWINTGDSYLWAYEGNNSFEVRVVNQFGVEGAISKAIFSASKPASPTGLQIK